MHNEISTIRCNKTFSDFVNGGQSDAEYYQPKYDDLFSRLSKFETKRLEDIVRIRFRIRKYIYRRMNIKMQFVLNRIQS